jgi:hypothetical protein
MLASSAVMLDAWPAQTIGLPAPDEYGGGLRLVFSETGHFHGETIEVAITASAPGAKIYYTTNGAEPTSDSAEYSSPLTFSVPAWELNAVTLKAVAVYGDTVTRPLVHTYFLGHDIEDRFDTLIFSLSADPAHLFDYDDGILIEGRDRDDFIMQNPDTVIRPIHPANFNRRGRESERPVFVETFTPDGERVVAQSAGLRVHGNWSRAYDQKSLRLIARREYEPDAGKFHFDFFGNDTVVYGFGAPLAKYDQLILRNGGSGRNYGLLRNELGCELARMAGLRVATPVRAAAVFLNGEYYGFAWLQVRINNKYLQDLYSAPTDEFQIVGEGERRIVAGDAALEEEIGRLNELFDQDLTDDAVFAELEALVDMDELLLYYALQTAADNFDWPWNNLRRWRYTGPQTEGLPPELDGRWRHVIFDLDAVLGLLARPVDPNKPTFEQMMDEKHDRYSYVLAPLLLRPDTANKFVMMMCDMAANVVTERNVRAIADRLFDTAYNEIWYTLEAEKYPEWVTETYFENRNRDMVTFAAGRADYIYRALREHFGFGPEMFTVTVTGGEAVIGSQKALSSRYFAHLTIPLRPALPKFTVFDHWLINGGRIYDEEVFVSAADARGGVVSAELVTREEIPPLIFGEAYASPERSGCVLVNTTGKTVRTAGLFLSNDPNNLSLWELPNARIAPGRSLRFAGRNGAGIGDLLSIQMGFSVRSGRVLILSDAGGRVLDHIIVP